MDFFKKEKIDNDNQNEKLSKTFKTLIDNIYQDNSQEIKRTFTPINLEYKIFCQLLQYYLAKEIHL